MKFIHKRFTALCVCLTFIFCSNLTVFAYGTDSLQGEALSDVEVLAPEKEKAIREDYLSLENEFEMESKEDLSILYYGTYHDCELISMYRWDLAYAAVVEEIKIGNYRFRFSSGSVPLLHKEHTFIRMEDAYKQGFLNDEDIAQFAEVFKIVGDGERFTHQPDVEAQEWYYYSVMEAMNRRVMFGLDINTFDPTGIMSRGQFATVLYRLENRPKAQFSPKFSDVSDGYFYSMPVMWTSETDIVEGYGDSHYFGPADGATREQMITMLYRYACYKKFPVDKKESLDSFPDGDKVSDFAKEAMEWAVASKIITGREGYLEPQELISRAECAIIINRFIIY